MGFPYLDSPFFEHTDHKQHHTAYTENHQGKGRIGSTAVPYGNGQKCRRVPIHHRIFHHRKGIFYCVCPVKKPADVYQQKGAENLKADPSPAFIGNMQLFLTPGRALQEDR